MRYTQYQKVRNHNNVKVVERMREENLTFDNI